LLAHGCEQDVEAVQGEAGTDSQGEFLSEFRRQQQRFLTSTLGRKPVTADKLLKISTSPQGLLLLLVLLVLHLI